MYKNWGKNLKRKTPSYTYDKFKFFIVPIQTDNQNSHFHFIGFPSSKNNREPQDL